MGYTKFQFYRTALSSLESMTLLSSLSQIGQYGCSWSGTLLFFSVHCGFLCTKNVASLLLMRSMFSRLGLDHDQCVHRLLLNTERLEVDFFTGF